MQCKNLPLKNKTKQKKKKRRGGIFHHLSYEFSDHDCWTKQIECQEKLTERWADDDRLTLSLTIKE